MNHRKKALFETVLDLEDLSEAVPTQGVLFVARDEALTLSPVASP